MAEATPRAAKSDRHWSGVEKGSSFELAIAYDPAVYSQAQVLVPFLRTLPDGLSSCTSMDYTANGQAGDSKYHISKAIRARCAPPLIGARPLKKQKVFVAKSMTSFFVPQPRPPSPVAAEELPDPSAEATPVRTPQPRQIPLHSTMSDRVGDIAEGAATWDTSAGVWTVQADHPELQLFAAFMTPGQRQRLGVQAPEPDIQFTDVGCTTPSAAQATMPDCLKLCSASEYCGSVHRRCE